MGSDGAAWLRLLRHLADARRALVLGNLDQASTEVEAAIALDAGFVAALSLRDEIVARMSDVVAAATPATPATPAEPAHENGDLEAQPSLDRAPAKRHQWSLPWLMLVLIIGSVALVGMMWRQRQTALSRIEACQPMPAAKASADHRAPSPPATVARTITAVFVAEPPAAITTPDTADAWTSPRLAQLDVRPHWRASAIHVADSALLRDLEQGVSELWIGKLTRDRDAIFVGASDEDQWDILASFLKPNGVVWLIYPNRLGAEGAAAATSATAGGFAAVKRLHYSAGYTAEKFVPRRSRR